MSRPAGKPPLVGPPPLPHQTGTPDPKLVTLLAKLFRDEIRRGPRPDLVAINQLALLLAKDDSALPRPMDKARWIFDLLNRTMASVGGGFSRSAPRSSPLNKITIEILRERGINYGADALDQATQLRRRRFRAPKQ
jgi:hypothetical protein